MKIEIDEELPKKWAQLRVKLRQRFGKVPDLNGVLFLIGVQELGKGKHHYTKEEKQDLMHIAICKVLSFSGYYTLKGTDKEGWPHWELVQKLPHFDLLAQEQFLIAHVIEYFEQETDL